MQTLTETISNRLALEKELKALTEEYEKKKDALVRKISESKEKEQILTDGLDLDKIELGRNVIFIKGNPYARVDRRVIADAAIEDIACGCVHLKERAFGNKIYGRFFESADCRYGFCPTYGSIEDEIGLKNPTRELTPEEKEAAIYYIKVYPKLTEK